MLVVLLQRGSSNWMPLLLPLIAFIVIFKITRWLIHFIEKRKSSKLLSSEESLEWEKF